VGGIRGFIGPNGSGKTLAMTEKMALPAWRRGHPVVANYTLLPEALGYAADLYRPLESWRHISKIGVQCRDCFKPFDEAARLHHARWEPEGGCPTALTSLTENRPATLLIDEVSSAFPSRGASDMPSELQRMLHQFRKPMVSLGWSGVSWARADKIIREATQYVTVAWGRFPDSWQRDEKGKPLKDERGRKIRSVDAWGANRLFRFKHYDAMEFEEFSLDDAVVIKPVRAEWYWRPKRDGYRAYRTSDQVLLLDHVDATGVCVSCDGVKRRHSCSCSKVGVA